MQNLFYQNHHEPNGSFTHNLLTHDVLTATTLHPIKNHTYQYRLHSFLQGQHLRDLRHQKIILQREIRQMDLLAGQLQPRVGHQLSLPPSLMKTIPKTRQDVLEWEYLTSKVLYSRTTANPKRDIESPQKHALDGILLEVIQLINRNARQRGRTIDYKDILYGYRRVNPLHGADYVLDLLLVYRKHKGRRMTVPVRRHAYIQQTFTEIQFREEEDNELSLSTSTPHKKMSTTAHLLQKWSHDLYKVAWGNAEAKPGLEPETHAVLRNISTIAAPSDDIIHFVLPLAGRYNTFEFFITNFESVCLNNSNPQSVALAVMLFESDDDATNSENTKLYMSSLQARYPGYDLRVVELAGPFSRGIALQHGTDLYNNSSLMFFIDVDIFFDVTSLQRIRANTRLGSQVYFPIVFSRYEPSSSCTVGRCSFEEVEEVMAGNWKSQRSYDNRFGYWRLFGFGISAMYRADLNRVGGFDKNIQGWGKEDVNLYNQFVSHNVSIFRSVDIGLVHMYHPIDCDKSLEDVQYQMCLGSKAATYGGSRHLAAVVFNTPVLFHRGNPEHIMHNDSPLSVNVMNHLIKLCDYKHVKSLSPHVNAWRDRRQSGLHRPKLTKLVQLKGSDKT